MVFLWGPCSLRGSCSLTWGHGHVVLGFAACVQVVLGVNPFCAWVKWRDVCWDVAQGERAACWEGREVAVAPGSHLRDWWRSSFWAKTARFCCFYPGEMRIVLLLSPHPCEAVLVLELSPNAFSIT